MNWGDPRLPVEFWASVIPEPMGGCWFWLGAGAGRYGRFDNTQTHRLTYTVFVEDPGDLIVHHKCFIPSCCNPAHLEAVSDSEHRKRHNRRLWPSWYRPPIQLPLVQTKIPSRVHALLLERACAEAIPLAAYVRRLLYRDIGLIQKEPSDAA